MENIRKKQSPREHEPESSDKTSLRILAKPESEESTSKSCFEDTKKTRENVELALAHHLEASYNGSSEEMSYDDMQNFVHEKNKSFQL